MSRSFRSLGSVVCLGSAIALFGCSSSSESDDGICDHPAAGLCNESHGVPSGGWSSIESQCKAQSGNPVRGGACPTDKRVGCCRYPGSTTYTVQCSYAPRTAADQGVCASGGGTWTPG